MARKTGRTRNFNEISAISSAISLNDTTSTTLSVANSERIFWAVSIPTAAGPGLTVQIWLKLQSASIDNDKKGINLSSGDYWEMPVDNIYTGEISAIVENGTEDVFITEF
jgi:hypothetical protein